MSPEEIRVGFVKNFLVVGEKVKVSHRIVRWDFNNLTISLVLVSALIPTIAFTITYQGIWFLIVGLLLIFSAFYLVQVYNVSIYFVTKYRIIKYEKNRLITLFKSLEVKGNFSDIHYEHVESVRVGTPKLDSRRLWGGMFIVLISWGILASQSFVLDLNSPFNPAVFALFGLGFLNILISIPKFNAHLEVRSVSGSLISLPASKLPPNFLQEIVQNSRYFLSFGGD